MAQKTNIKLSIVIPYYESDPGKPEILKRCVDSLSGYDELIVVWNDKMGYAKAINKGLALAKGDFICVVTDDVIVTSGSLEDLCVPGCVTSPKVNGVVQPFWGVMFCVPKTVYNALGGLYEGYRVSYYDDADYYNTFLSKNIKCAAVPEVEVSHPEGGRTLHTFSDWQEFEQENKNRFIRRWGKLPDF